MRLTLAPSCSLTLLLLAISPPPSDSTCVNSGITHVDRDGRTLSRGWHRLSWKKLLLRDRELCGYPLSGAGLANGTFDANLDGWVVEESGGSLTPGTATWVAGRAQIDEGDSFLTTLRQTFVVPPRAVALQFDVYPDVPGFDLGDSFIPDAFEVSLLDPTLHSVVPTWMPGAGSFFNVQEDLGLNLGDATSFDGLTVELDLTGVPAGTIVTLFFDQIGADLDLSSGVQVDNVLLVQTPTGACSLPDGSCESLTEEECSAQGGTYGGDDSECSTIECPSDVALELWPPNHKYVEIDIAAVAGVTGDGTISILITSITQDEPVNTKGDGNTSCDGTGIGTGIAQLRAERNGLGNGRVYHVQYAASSSQGGSCSATVVVSVPHDQSGAPAIDDGQLFESTSGCP